ncbi:MAG: tetratricopeptide repeat protein [Pseudomonadota bacterium]
MNPSVRESSPIIVDYPNLNVLVVDDSPQARGFWFPHLNTLGIEKVSWAHGPSEAISQLKANEFDLILLEYDLQYGQGGIALLEKLRNSNLIPSITALILVTTEQRYDRVMSAMEFTPDDYIVRPFSLQILHGRLDRVLYRKKCLATIYGAMQKQSYEQALNACDQVVALLPAYQHEALKIKGDILMLTGRYEDAERFYSDLKTERTWPWVKLGWAKALYQMQNFKKASDILNQLITEHIAYIEAYDWMAKVQQSLNDVQGAQRILERAALRSPRALKRQRSLGRLAFENQDWDTAEKALSRVLEVGSETGCLETGDFMRLSKVHWSQGNLEAARAVIQEGTRMLPATAELQVCESVMNARLAMQQGDFDIAADCLQNASRAFPEMEVPPVELSIDLLNAALEQNDQALAQSVAQTLLQNHHDNSKVINAVETAFASVGQVDTAQALINESTQEIIAQNNLAVQKVKQGLYMEAIETLLTTLERFPANRVLNLNAARSILLWVKHNPQAGKNNYLLEVGESCLGRVRDQSPDHSELMKLELQYRGLAQQGGRRAG